MSKLDKAFAVIGLVGGGALALMLGELAFLLTREFLRTVLP